MCLTIRFRRSGLVGAVDSSARGAGGVGVEVATGVDAGAGADVVGAVVVTGFVPAEN